MRIRIYYLCIYAHPSPFRGEGWAILYIIFISYKEKKEKININNIYSKRKKKLVSPGAKVRW